MGREKFRDNGQKLDHIIEHLHRIDERLCKMAQVVDDLVAQVAKQKTVLASVKELLQKLFAIVQAGISTGDLAKAQAALDDLKAQDDEIAQAVIDNTPPTPPTP